MNILSSGIQFINSVQIGLGLVTAKIYSVQRVPNTSYIIEKDFASSIVFHSMHYTGRRHNFC